MGQLKKLRFLRSSDLLDEQEMKNIRGGVLCKVYDPSLLGGAGSGGSGGNVSTGSAGSYIFSQSCDTIRIEDCERSCNSQYAQQSYFCICR